MDKFVLLFTLTVTLGTVALGSLIFEPFAVPHGTPEETEDIAPKPCQTVAQWEGRASEWDHITESNNRFKVSFDGVGLRKRVLEEKKSFMPGKRFYEYIMEYKTNKLFTINLNYNTCKVTNLTQPWQNHTIPTDATMEDEYELGAPGSGFKAREWSDRLPARRAESWIGIFSIDGCWPIVEVFTDDNPTNRVSLTTRFFDLMPGIANMSVFDPPEYCFSQNDWPNGSEPEAEFEPELDVDPPITNQYVGDIDEDGEESDDGYVQSALNYLKYLFNVD